MPVTSRAACETAASRTRCSAALRRKARKAALSARAVDIAAGNHQRRVFIGRCIDQRHIWHDRIVEDARRGRGARDTDGGDIHADFAQSQHGIPEFHLLEAVKEKHTNLAHGTPLEYAVLQL